MVNKKLAVLCAYPATRNMGMITVDLALHAVLERYAGHLDYSFYTYGDLEGLKTEQLGIPFDYRHVIEDREDFLKSDYFLFWGDFIHARSYQIDLKFRNLPQAEIDELLNLSFLSEISEDRLKKAIVYGGTIITNEATDDADPVYGRLFERFFRHCGTVLFRDPLSAAKVAPLRKKESSFGCDCALLLKDSDLSLIEGFSKKTEREGFGFFLSRSPAMIQSCIFAYYLSYKTGLKCRWLNWLPVTPRRQFVARLLGFKLPGKYPTPGEILSELSGYEFIVTDTYHLCINAWRMGVPAVCIGEGAGNLKTTLNDKKKEILLEIYGGRKFYIFTEHLKSLIGIPLVARKVIKLFNDKVLINQFRENLKCHIEMAEKRLEAALGEVTES